MARTRWPAALGTPASCTGWADQAGTAGGCHKDLGPGRQIVSQDSPDGVSRIGGQAGTQAPDPMPVSSQNRGSRAGSTINILPAGPEALSTSSLPIPALIGGGVMPNARFFRRNPLHTP